jgi:Holliday junction DNA helicase RuvA
MLATLKGRITEIFQDFFILEINGIGYRLKAPGSLLAELTIGQETKFYVHEHIREDAYDLYAFPSLDGLDFFEQLLSVSGVGPKVALAVCSAAPLDTLRARLTQGDVDWLASLPGLGKKTAQKIVLELKGRLVEVTGNSPADRDLAEALIKLGYSNTQARDAAKDVSPDLTDPADRLRAALRLLSK